MRLSRVSLSVRSSDLRAASHERAAWDTRKNNKKQKNNVVTVGNSNNKETNKQHEVTSLIYFRTPFLTRGLPTGMPSTICELACKRRSGFWMTMCEQRQCCLASARLFHHTLGRRVCLKRDVQQCTWAVHIELKMQENLDSVRLRAAHLGVALRPSCTLAHERTTGEQDSQGDEQDASSGSKVGDRCPTYTPTNTWFLRVLERKQGVLQIHEAGSSYTH